MCNAGTAGKQAVYSGTIMANRVGLPCAFETHNISVSALVGKTIVSTGVVLWRQNKPIEFVTHLDPAPEWLLTGPRAANWRPAERLASGAIDFRLIPRRPHVAATRPACPHADFVLRNCSDLNVNCSAGGPDRGRVGLLVQRPSGIGGRLVATGAPPVVSR